MDIRGWEAVSFHYSTWWRHQMETFSALLSICAGNSPVPGEFHAQSPVTRSFDVFFDLRLNKRLSKQSWGWWFETILCLLMNKWKRILYMQTRLTDICREVDWPHPSISNHGVFCFYNLRHIPEDPSGWYWYIITYILLGKTPYYIYIYTRN